MSFLSPATVYSSFGLSSLFHLDATYGIQRMDSLIEFVIGLASVSLDLALLDTLTGQPDRACSDALRFPPSECFHLDFGSLRAN